MNFMTIYSSGILIFIFTCVLVINVLGIEDIVATSIGWVCVSLIILLLLICWLEFILSLIKAKSEEKSSVNNVNLAVELKNESKVNNEHNTFDRGLRKKK